MLPPAGWLAGTCAIGQRQWQHARCSPRPACTTSPSTAPCHDAVPQCPTPALPHLPVRPQYRCAKAGALREEHRASLKPEFRAALEALAARPTKVGWAASCHPACVEPSSRCYLLATGCV